MESITLEFIGELVAFLVALFGGLGYLYKTLKTWLTKLISDQQKETNEKLDGINARLDIIDRETTKNFLVRFLSEVERGERIDEIEKERFQEQYDHYIDIKGNSYIKNKYNELHEKGLL